MVNTNWLTRFLLRAIFYFSIVRLQVYCSSRHNFLKIFIELKLFVEVDLISVVTVWLFWMVWYHSDYRSVSFWSFLKTLDEGRVLFATFNVSSFWNNYILLYPNFSILEISVKWIHENEYFNLNKCLVMNHFLILKKWNKYKNV